MAAGLGVVESGHIYMGDAGVTPIGATWRPTHQLYAAETFFGGIGHYLFEIQVVQNGTDEAELHDFAFFATSI